MIFLFEVGLVSNENNIQKIIEYTGKTGNIINFSYSEFYSDNYVDASQKDFRIDLSEGNILAYKGALIEILDVSNIKMKYKVIRHFR